MLLQTERRNSGPVIFHNSRDSDNSFSRKCSRKISSVLSRLLPEKMTCCLCMNSPPHMCAYLDGNIVFICTVSFGLLSGYSIGFIRSRYTYTWKHLTATRNVILKELEAKLLHSWTSTQRRSLFLYVVTFMCKFISPQSQSKPRIIGNRQYPFRSLFLIS